MAKPDNDTKKKKYSRPELIAVSLRSQKSSLGMCKTSELGTGSQLAGAGCAASGTQCFPN